MTVLEQAEALSEGWAVALRLGGGPPISIFPRPPGNDNVVLERTVVGLGLTGLKNGCTITVR